MVMSTEMQNGTCGAAGAKSGAHTGELPTVTKRTGILGENLVLQTQLSVRQYLTYAPNRGTQTSVS